jgi:mRNA-degrading endonuclease RelE of RelBE toxin-antitoxin system
MKNMNKIEFTRKAARQLRKLQSKDHRVIVAECYKLSDMPNCANVKALVSHEYEYRLRVGNFRVLFNFDDVVRIVSIEEVRKRDERTY